MPTTTNIFGSSSVTGTANTCWIKRSLVKTCMPCNSMVVARGCSSALVRLTPLLQYTTAAMLRRNGRIVQRPLAEMSLLRDKDLWVHVSVFSQSTAWRAHAYLRQCLCSACECLASEQACRGQMLNAGQQLVSHAQSQLTEDARTLRLECCRMHRSSYPQVSCWLSQNPPCQPWTWPSL